MSGDAGKLIEKALQAENWVGARKLIAVGESRPDPTLEASTLAAWTMLANEMMNLDEVLNK